MPRVSVALVAVLAAAYGFAQNPTPPANPPAATPPAAESRPAESKPDHLRLGLRCNTIELEKSGIARVDAVQAGSPADKAGVKTGDVIVTVNGEKIADDASYRKAMAKRKTGDAIALKIKRGAQDLDVTATLATWKRVEADEITVQHCLIGCSDGKNPQDRGEKKRSVEEARKLAYELLQKVKDGADFGAIVKQYTEDPGSKDADPPGKYWLFNDGKTPPAGAIARANFVQGFTAVAFALEVGDAAISPYDKELSPFGFHIIKRIK